MPGGLAIGPAAGRERWIVKKILELVVCFLHPVAVVLMWVNLASRTDLTGTEKLIWGAFGLIPLVPFLYVLTGGDLW